MHHFDARPSRLLVWLLASLATLAGGCAGGASGSLVALLVLVSALLSMQRRAAAAEPVLDRPVDAPPVVYPGGAPMPEPPCDGTRVESCESGHVRATCVPKGQKVQPPAPFVSCGYGSCVAGHDQSLCPVRETHAVAATDEETCKKAYGSWEKACVNERETMACIPPVPTNYTGPNPNVRYVTCSGDHCAPETHPELCFDRRTGTTECAGPWQKACIKGRITEVCVPLVTMPFDTAKVRPFTDCGEGRCAVGQGTKCD
jgi:hypothetical protein